MNKVVLMGRLTRDPETRYTQGNNTAVCSFSLAVNRRFKQEGQPDADFINVTAWAKTAEFVSKYFTKGQQIGVIGRIQTRNYDDKDGKKVFGVYIPTKEEDCIQDILRERFFETHPAHFEEYRESQPFSEFIPDIKRKNPYVPRLDNVGQKNENKNHHAQEKNYEQKF